MPEQSRLASSQSSIPPPESTVQPTTSPTLPTTTTTTAVPVDRHEEVSQEDIAEKSLEDCTEENCVHLAQCVEHVDHEARVLLALSNEPRRQLPSDDYDEDDDFDDMQSMVWSSDEGDFEDCIGDFYSDSEDERDEAIGVTGVLDHPSDEPGPGETPRGPCQAREAVDKARQPDNPVVEMALKQLLNLFSEKTPNQVLSAMGVAAHAGDDPSKWEVIRAIVDSGASVPVIHPATAQGYEVTESEASKAGVEYETAGGHCLPCLGRKRIAVLTQEGTVRGYNSQCAEVTKSLQSVRALIKNSHAVLFGLGPKGDQHVIVNKLTGEVNHLEDDGVNYIQKLLVIPPDKVNAVQNKMWERQMGQQQASLFSGPGS